MARSHRATVLSPHNPEIINRWLPYVWDRHTARSRTTAGVLVPMGLE
jgi:hypothetical protein